MDLNHLLKSLQERRTQMGEGLAMEMEAMRLPYAWAEVSMYR